MKRISSFLIVACLLISVTPLNVSADETQDIPANAQATGVHDSLVAALAHTNLVAALQADGPFTVFAPTDAAFAAAGIDLADFDTDEENNTLADILLYHVYNGSVAAADVTDGLTVEMLNGDDATFAVTNGNVVVESANVTTADVIASNGIIHVIDAVMMPPVDVVEPTLNIPETAQSTGVHGSLVAALAQAGLVETLQGDGPFTVFAPTDEAFAAAGIDLSTFDTPEENATLSDILLYHVYSGAVASSAVTDGLAVTMVNGDKATFSVANGVVSVGGANVTGADVATTNGIIHVIDKVLMPPPGDICYNVITHTIVAGASNVECNSYMYVENYSMMGQTITGCYNTVTHAVANISQVQCNGYMWTPAVSIAMTAGATTIHTSLVAALTVADLVTTLSGTDEYTVFAPTDAAFAAAGIDLDSFTTDAEIAVLADILLYHVVAGTTMSGDLADGVNTVTAANGDTLDITVSSTGVTVGASNAAVTLADVPASNGVIHVIDAVLTPPADPVVDPFEGIDCAVTIGVGASGYAFTPDVVTIAVGETVCWSWEDESMPHNVKEITGYKSTNFVEGGITSGAAASTVNFHHTFTEDTTFFYACEPHVALNMFGEVVVGDGGDDDDAASTVDSDDEENTPGFMVISTLIAVIGALALMGRTSRDE